MSVSTTFSGNPSISVSFHGAWLRTNKKSGNALTFQHHKCCCTISVCCSGSEVIQAVHHRVSRTVVTLEAVLCSSFGGNAHVTSLFEFFRPSVAGSCSCVVADDGADRSGSADAVQWRHSSDSSCPCGQSPASPFELYVRRNSAIKIRCFRWVLLFEPE